MNYKKDILKIIVGGPGGTGSSSVARFLAEKFDLFYIYGGSIMRAFAKQNGFKELVDFFYDPEMQKIDWDKKVEDKIRKALLSKQRILVEGKVWAGIATLENIAVDYKVWITASLEARVRRIMNRKYGISVYKSVLSLTEQELFKKEKTLLEARINDDKQRYWEKYKVHYDQPELYNDLVLDTTNIPLDKVKKIVLKDIRDNLGLE